MANLATPGMMLLLSCCGWASITVPNFSFENPNVSVWLCGSSDDEGCEYHPVGADWTFSGSAGIVSDGGTFNLDSPGIDNPAPNGTQAAFLQYDPGNPASSPGNISQNINGLDPTGSYVLSFEAAQRPETVSPTGNFLYGGGLDLYAYWCPGDSNCSPIDFLDFADLLPTYLSFAEYTTSFIAGATYGELEFQAYDPLGGDRSDFLDDVQIDGVPEPSSGLMALSGIGLIGLELRRRLVHSRSLPS